jgi:hypothetical protein
MLEELPAALAVEPPELLALLGLLEVAELLQAARAAASAAALAIVVRERLDIWMLL